MFKHTIISFIIIAAAGIALWATFLSKHAENQQNIPSILIPDAVMENVTATIMDKAGNPKIKIFTPRMIHYVENDTSQFTLPNLLLYRESAQPWTISAKFAKATEGVDHIDFWDDVIISHPGDQNNPATVIKTLKLTVYTKKQIAETNEFISFIQPNIIVNARGMYADMNTGNIKLLSETRGEYAPSS